MPRDPERRQRRSAKRWLWAIVAACLALAALIAYTSLRAPDPASRTSDAQVPASSAAAPGDESRNELAAR
ncbi:hypothetical protein [Sphingobium agri]|uniref:hypothetical protein n=1 Tax=Sphingobium sp. GCM10012300 TaxID=3317347 RepID=UPI0036D35AF8